MSEAIYTNDDEFLEFAKELHNTGQTGDLSWETKEAMLSGTFRVPKNIETVPDDPDSPAWEYVDASEVSLEDHANTLVRLIESRGEEVNQGLIDEFFAVALADKLPLQVELESGVYSQYRMWLVHR